MNQSKLDTKALFDKLLASLQKLRRYTILAFLVLVVAIYAFIAFRISNLSNAQPTADQVSSQVQASRVLHVDKTVVQQLQSLQDNSVNVKALFNQERANPFQ
jgi:hypothetical protein